MQRYTMILIIRLTLVPAVLLLTPACLHAQPAQQQSNLPQGQDSPAVVVHGTVDLPNGLPASLRPEIQLLAWKFLKDIPPTESTAIEEVLIARTTADSQGVFTLMSKSQAWPLSLRALAPATWPQLRHLSQRTETVHFKLRPSMPLHGRVVNTDAPNQPISRARIVARFTQLTNEAPVPSCWEAEVFSDAEGLFNINDAPVGKLILLAYHKDYRDTSSTVTTESPYQITLSMKPGLTLNGQVLDRASGQPLQDATVKGAYTVVPTFYSRTSSSGKFALTGLDKGELMLTIGKQGWRTLRAPINIPDSGQPRHEVIFLTKALQLRGTVINTERTPEPGVEIRVWACQAGEDDCEYHSARTDAAGMFLVAGLPTDSLVSLIAAKDKVGVIMTTFETRQSAEREVQLHLAPPRDVSARIPPSLLRSPGVATWVRSGPVPWWWPQPTSLADPSAWGYATFGQEGAILMRGLWPGPYELRVALSTGEWGVHSFNVPWDPSLDGPCRIDIDMKLSADPPSHK